jgi:hypothetical protein
LSRKEKTIREQPDFSRLLQKMNLNTPLIGLYDAPDPKVFQPCVTPQPGECVFTFYKSWIEGKTLHLTPNRFGCGGCGRWMFDIMLRSRQDFIKFLVDTEGLKASRALMEQWIDVSRPYQRRHDNIMIGPLKPEQWKFLRTVTFWVDADQLSVLVYGTQYQTVPEDPQALIAPFGSGCMQLIPFKDLGVPQAALGATDIAMRRYLLPELLAVSVTRSMFQRLCSLDEDSFLYKPFLKNLQAARNQDISSWLN